MKLKGEDISLCFINRDGARWLPCSLAPLAPLVGETLVVDTGSRDNSIEIAHDCGARVVEIAWPGDFSLARNVYLEQARRPWILALDDDEILFPEDLSRLLDTLSFTQECGVWFTVRHYTGDTGRPGWIYSPSGPRLPISADGFSRTRNVKLFPNVPGLSYRYPVHESVLPGLMERGIPMAESGVAVHHLGLANLSEEDRNQRIRRNIELGMRKIEAFPNDAAGYVELAELILEYGNPDRAVRILRQAVCLAPGYFDGCLRLAEAHEEAGQEEEALEIYNGLEKVRPNEPRLRTALGRLAYEEGDFQRAAAYLEDAGDYLSCVRLAFIHMHLENPERALQAARKAVQLNPKRAEGRVVLMRAQAELQDRGAT